MSDHIDREKLLAEVIKERDKEMMCRSNARHHRHYEECNMHNHAVQILSNVILIVRGMEAEDAETKQAVKEMAVWIMGAGTAEGGSYECAD